MGAVPVTCNGSSNCDEQVRNGQILGIIIFAAYVVLFIICLTVAIVYSQCCKRATLLETALQVDEIPLLDMTNENDYDLNFDV